MQLELFPWEDLSDQERRYIVGQIRNAYWHIRNSREWDEAKRRKYYRKAAAQKKRLQLAGVSKREILDLLACCRGKCRPGEPCQYCP